jgi:hypothetical protein
MLPLTLPMNFKAGFQHVFDTGNGYVYALFVAPTNSALDTLCSVNSLFFMRKIQLEIISRLFPGNKKKHAEHLLSQKCDVFRTKAFNAIGWGQFRHSPPFVMCATTLSMGNS